MARFRQIIAPVTLVLFAACGKDVGTLLSPDGSNGQPALGTADINFMLGATGESLAYEFQAIQIWRSPFAVRYVALRYNILTFAFGANGICTPAASNATDTNHNGIPDDATLTFTPQNCTLLNNSASGGVSGTMRVQDVGGLWGLRLTFNQVKVDFAPDATSHAVFQLDGTREIRIQPGGVTTTNQVNQSLSATSSTGSATLSLANNFTTTFTPDGTGKLDPNLNVPAGSLSTSGSVVLTAAGTGAAALPGGLQQATFTATFSTPTPLHFDGQCTSEYVFSSGQLKINITSTIGSASQTIQWPACGSPPPGTKV